MNFSMNRAMDFNDDNIRKLVRLVSLVALGFFGLIFFGSDGAWARKVEVKEVRMAKGLPDSSQDDSQSSNADAIAQDPDDSDVPSTDSRHGRTAPIKTGKGAAREHFVKRKTASSGGGSSSSGLTQDSHYLQLHVGGYVSSTAWKWGSSPQVENPGGTTLGVSYRVGEWVNSMDFLFRADFNTYSLPDGRAVKMSLLPILMFPDATSRFPLYFGLGAGLGIFFNQVPSSSALSLDYQLIAGARFFNVVGTTGFTIEGGMKNHFNLLSSGQFNGAFVSVGSVWTF